MIEVFPTARAIRHRMAQGGDNNRLLPLMMTMDEFQSRLYYLPHRAKLDPTSRQLALYRACEGLDLSPLGLENDFLFFLKSSDFLFRFFDELAFEGVDLETLKDYDTYQHFHDHIAVLSIIQKRYQNYLERHSLYDRAYGALHGVFHHEYARSLGDVYVTITGYLNAFEWSLLVQLSHFTHLVITFTHSRFNPHWGEKIRALGIEPLDGGVYTMDMTEGSIVLDAMLSPLGDRDIRFFPVAIRLTQIGIIKEQIYQWLCQGIAPEDIVVIVPDESFALAINDNDHEGLFNFAMGQSLRYHYAFLALQRLGIWLKDADTLLAGDEPWDPAEAKRLMVQGCTWEECMELIHPIIEKFGREREQVIEALYPLGRAMTYDGPWTLLTMLHMIEETLGGLTRDDIRGGKITVLGILETRAVRYKAVMIVDFNESIVPKRSVKDMFLNSALRHSVGLPTRQDRDNLQKLYYEQVIRRAEHVAMSYVESEQESPSRFIDELFGDRAEKKGETSTYNRGFNTLLARVSPSYSPHVIAVQGVYDGKKHPLSATKLLDFMGCRRKFYWKYVANIPEPQERSGLVTPALRGEKLHAVIAHLSMDERWPYASRDHDDLRSLLDRVYGDDPLWLVEKEIAFQKLHALMAWDEKRFESGYRIVAVEHACEKMYRGLKLKGRIDRIDQAPDGTLEILDFKTGKVSPIVWKEDDTPSTFQPFFYPLLIEDWGDIREVSLVQIAPFAVHSETAWEEKRVAMDQALDAYAQVHTNFPLCDEKSITTMCRYCPYAVLCLRG